MRLILSIFFQNVLVFIFFLFVFIFISLQFSYKDKYKYNHLETNTYLMALKEIIFQPFLVFKLFLGDIYGFKGF